MANKFATIAKTPQNLFGKGTLTSRATNIMGDDDDDDGSLEAQYEEVKSPIRAPPVSASPAKIAKKPEPISPRANGVGKHHTNMSDDDDDIVAKVLPPSIPSTPKKATPAMTPKPAAPVATTTPKPSTETVVTTTTTTVVTAVEEPKPKKEAVAEKNTAEAEEEKAEEKKPVKKRGGGRKKKEPVTPPTEEDDEPKTASSSSSSSTEEPAEDASVVGKRKRNKPDTDKLKQKIAEVKTKSIEDLLPKTTTKKILIETLMKVKADSNVLSEDDGGDGDDAPEAVADENAETEEIDTTEKAADGEATTTDGDEKPKKKKKKGHESNFSTDAREYARKVLSAELLEVFVGATMHTRFRKAVTLEPRDVFAAIDSRRPRVPFHKMEHKDLVEMMNRWMESTHTKKIVKKGREVEVDEDGKPIKKPRAKAAPKKAAAAAATETVEKEKPARKSNKRARTDDTADDDAAEAEVKEEAKPKAKRAYNKKKAAAATSEPASDEDAADE
jgi:hypothetical protein